MFKERTVSKKVQEALKTFRVVDKPAANTIRIYPAIIDAAEGSIGSKEYANVSNAPADNAKAENVPAENTGEGGQKSDEQ